ncbi:MAG TPA: thioredoxin family protein [Blastocatellia bacterium]|nr:thioredoxin family protein [Blastocatellia bacterium]
MKIEVLGPGCARCHTTLRTVEHALQALGMEAEVIHIHDPREFAKRGVLFTPAIFINGVMKAAGRIPKLEEVKHWLVEIQETSTQQSERLREEPPATP